MKKFIAIILCLTLSLGVFCGCESVLNDVVPPQTVTVDDMTMTLPGYFINWSKEDWAKDFPFVYGFNSSAVLGVKEEIASLEASFPGLTAKDYADLFVEYNGLTSTVTEEDGLVTFSYTATSDGTIITYKCGVLKGQKNFWVIQCYCAQSDLSQFEADFIEILKSVKV
jgi:hypothetical protein